MSNAYELNSSMDFPSLMRAVKFSLMRQVETHQKMRRMKEQIVNSYNSTKLITQLHTFDVNLINELTKDLKDSRLNEAQAREKCLAVEMELDALKNEMEVMHLHALRLQEELDTLHSSDDINVITQADREVEAMIGDIPLRSRTRGPVAHEPLSFDSWNLSRFVEVHSSNNRPDERKVLSDEGRRPDDNSTTLFLARDSRPGTSQISQKKKIPAYDSLMHSDGKLYLRGQGDGRPISRPQTTAGRTGGIRNQRRDRNDISSSLSNVSLPYLRSR
jgi:hypothetical protein